MTEVMSANDYYTLRTAEEIETMQEKYCDLVWYARSHAKSPEGIASMRAEGRPEYIVEGAIAAVAKVEARYPAETESISDWDHGYNSGWLAALRWVLGGGEMDLDT